MKKREGMKRLLALVLTVIMVLTSMGSNTVYAAGLLEEIGGAVSGIRTSLLGEKSGAKETDGLAGKPSVISGSSTRAGEATAGVQRQADPSTMDTYMNELDFSKNTRNAGRLWTDKTVFAKGSSDTGDRKGQWDGNALKLTEAKDGVAGEIKLDDDFLHVYSALGSSEELTGVPPVRTVIVFDNSGSMYKSVSKDKLKPGENLWKRQRIALTVEAINRAIDALMEASQYNEVSVVLFGDGGNSGVEDNSGTSVHPYKGNSTAVTILPMKHYTPSIEEGEDYTPYLTAGWRNVIDEDFNGDKPNHTGNGSSESVEGGWVFVNNEIAGLNADDTEINAKQTWYPERGTGWNGWNDCGDMKFTAYQNGTTNIQAGYYVGMQELLKADKTVKVGTETYKCVPSLVMLTDGAATDMLDGDFVTPEKVDESADAAPKNRGFVNDTGNKLRSFTGNSEYIAADGKTAQKEIPNFWDMFVAEDEDKYYSASWHDKIDKTARTPDSTAEGKMKAVADTYSDSVASMLLGTLMTTAYYKEAVKDAYKMKESDDWNIYTISVDMTDPKDIPSGAAQAAKAASTNKDPKEELPQSWEYTITSNPPTMDPGNYFFNKDGELQLDWLTNRGYVDPEGNVADPLSIPTKTAYPDYSVGEMVLQGIVKAGKMLKGWSTTDSIEYTTKYQPWAEVKGIFITAPHKDNWAEGKMVNPWTHGNGYLLEAEQTVPYPNLANESENPYHLTKDDVIKNIDYATMAYYAQTSSDAAEDLTGTFVEIVNKITEPLFQPVGGGNDLGVDDSVTYMDPMGKYMEVKDVKNLSLFGELHGVTKTAEYNWKFNDDYMREHGGQGKESFPEGWYKGDNGTTAEQSSSGKDLPAKCGSAEEAWAAGWVYRVNSETAVQFVPSLNGKIDIADPDSKIKNTTYTFYRLTDENRTELLMNPAYGDKVPDSVTYDGTTLEHQKTPGVYALADLRIWVEDSGDYNSTAVDKSDANYDEALFVNVPVNMLPLRTVSINLGETGKSKDSWGYETNMTEGSKGYKASFPLRVFYTVGVMSDLLTADGSIDIAAGVSQEYLDRNRAVSDAAQEARGIAANSLEFFSNWYNPENRYDDYATTGTDYTYGDPVTSFSPSADNRYYIFEKALPLYNTAYVWVSAGNENLSAEDKALADKLNHGGLWKKVKLEQDLDKDKENYQTFDPLKFGGKLIAQDLDPAEITEIEPDKIKEQNQKNIWDALQKEDISSANDGEMILLKDHRLSDVTYTHDETDPFKSSDYFYLAIDYYTFKDGEAGKEGEAGSEQYVIARKGSEFGSAYASSGISNGDMLCWHDVSGTFDQDYPYLSRTETGDDSRGKNYIGYTDIYDTNGDLKNIENLKDQADDAAEIQDAGQWVVCAKPGGLRVGAMAQSVDAKGTEFKPYNKTYVEERFSDSKYKDADWGYYSDGNTTRTSNNYYLPTISSKSVASEDDIIVDAYLGNNGRLWVQDTNLLLTKRVVPGSTGKLPETSDDEHKKTFDFQVYVSGFTGTHQAIRVRYNEATKTWQRQLHFIDLELDSQRFLQTTDSERAVVDGTGRRLIAAGDGYVYADNTADKYDAANGGPYYVYIPESEGQGDVGGSDVTLRIYHNPYCTVAEDKTVSDVDIKVTYYDADGKVIEDPSSITKDFSGKRDFVAERATLVPVSEVVEGWSGPNGGDPTPDEFYLATLDPTEKGTSEIKIDSAYRTQSEFLTQPVYFGYKAEGIEADGIKGDSPKLTKEDLYVPVDTSGTNAKYGGDTDPWDHTAEVTLESGWGLAFSSIGSGTDYLLAEHIGEDDIDEGYDLHNIQHIQQNNNPVHPRSEFGDTYVYYVTGDTGANEEAGHFRNIWSPDKKETEINGKPIKDTDSNTKQGVQVGDELTYTIDWANTSGKTARVIITDPLDEGVDFVSASDPGKYYAESSEAKGLPEKMTIRDRTVVWDLGDRRANASGTVKLTVRVNEKAPAYWDYDMDGEPDGNAADDYMVRNRATVRVGENEWNTNYVQNPLGEPDKNETKIERKAGGADVTPEPEKDSLTTPKKDAEGKEIPDREAGPLVYVGDKITYEISWRNYENEDALVTVRDPLNANVKLISAHFDPGDDVPSVMKEKPDTGTIEGYKGAQKADLDNLEAVQTTEEVNIGTEEEENKVPVITYDAGAHQVVWNLGFQPAETAGKVTLVVEVLPDASAVGYVENTAYVSVNGEPEQQTKTVENPTPETKKIESDPGDGERVKVGDTIDYEIKWNKHEDEELNTVTVTDPLDPGVDFVSASYTMPDNSETVTLTLDSETAGGRATSKDKVPPVLGEYPVTIEYDAAKHIVTWTLKGDAAVPEGSVKLTVKVTSRALVNDAETGIIPGTEGLPDGDTDWWNYREGTGIESDGGQLLQNRATLQFDNDAEIVTDLVKNPVDPVKEEVADGDHPADGDQVQVGDEIHYRIYWQNYKSEEAVVTVEDPLDAGVDFVRAALDNGSIIHDGSAIGLPVTLNAGTDDEGCWTTERTTLSEEESIPVIQYFGSESVSGHGGIKHVVVWNLGVQQPNAEGWVDLYVRVNDGAVKEWQYGTEAETKDTPIIDDADKDHEVVDRANITVGNDPKIYTDVMENPIPEKTEETPGDGENVAVGQDITYKVHWKNGTEDTAAVIITDPLDPGVDFVSASTSRYPGEAEVTLDAAGDGASCNTGAENTTEYTVTVDGVEETRWDYLIKYEKESRTVTWTLPEQKPGAEGDVTLNVRVNKDAEKAWNYDGNYSADGMDNEVFNRASVQVGNDAKYTNVVENPLGKPQKTETEIQHGAELGTAVDQEKDLTKGEDGKTHGPLVYVGDKITYEITWENYKRQDAVIRIEDPLDANVKFVSAQFDTVNIKHQDGYENVTEPHQGAENATLEAGSTTGDTKPESASTTDKTVTIDDGQSYPVIAYDKSTNTVTWNLGYQPAGAAGKVTLVVEVLSTATPAGCVDNQATVWVDDSSRQTDIVENPTPETKKTEVTPGDGERVKVGEVIDYNISWNSHDTAAGEDGKIEKITVTDPLDPGVDFESASYGGVTLNKAAEDSDYVGDEITAHSDEWVSDETGKEIEGQEGKGYFSITITYNKEKHTVTWTLFGENTVKIEDSVDLKVRVTERALVNSDFKPGSGDESLLPGGTGNTNWDYRKDTGLETDGDQLVQNRAAVKFNDDAEIVTDLVKNPVGPKKEEITPGDGEQVQTGEEIHYQITWQNYKDVPAFVTVEDPLDVGVDFVRAVFTGKTTFDGTTKDSTVELNAAANQADCQTSERVTTATGAGGANTNKPVIQYFDSDGGSGTLTGKSHCVVWNLGVQEGLAEGTVDLYVRVNENAAKNWQYNTEAGDKDTPITDNSKDYEVVDRASVQVGNDSKIYSNVVENPVPDKTETNVNHAGSDTLVNRGENLKPRTDADGNEIPGTEVGPTVFVGDVITYEIGWRNASDKPADVIITDKLDDGVDFVEASYEILKADEANNSASSAEKTGGDGEDRDKPAVEIQYNAAAHTVVWTLRKRPTGAAGNVVLKVRVNSNAPQTGYVDNQATVQVGNSSKDTGIVENPTPKTEKTEESPGSGMQVMPGDEVTYKIKWNNYEESPAKVVVRDALDPGVNFASASFRGDGEGADNTLTLEKEKTAGSATASIRKEAGPVEEPETTPAETKEPTKAPAMNEANGSSGEEPTGIPAETKEPTGTPAEAKEPTGTPVEVNGISGGEPIGIPAETGPAEEPTGTSAETKEPDGTPAEVKEPTAAPENSGSDDEPVPAPNTPVEEIGQDPAVENEIQTIAETDGGCPVDRWKTTEIKRTVQLKNPKTGDLVNVDVTISYNTDNHEITWTFGEGSEAVPAGYEGEVTFTVIVNNDAEKLHSYGDNGKFKTNEDETNDDKIWNQGGVTVGSNPETLTNIIPNPTKPGKSETLVNDRDVSKNVVVGPYESVGPYVNVGDTITYIISWQNNARDAAGNLADAEICIVDPLDKNVEFVSAEGGGKYCASKDDILRAVPEAMREKIQSDENLTGHAVVWNLGTKTPRERGIVKLTVKVLPGALEPEQVGNEATVHVGNEPQQTDRIVNPVSEAGGLTVTKTVEGTAGDTNKEFHFTVTLSDRTVSGTYGEMKFADGVAEFTLKHGQSATANGLPAGTAYTVDEREADTDGYTTSASGSTGTIPEGDYAEAEFVNSKEGTPPPPPSEPGTGNLRVTKTVAGSQGDKTKLFNFTVRISPAQSGTYGEMTFTDGVASFALADGQSRTATGLPEGTTYTVTEAEANQDGYVTEMTGDSGSIEAESTADAAFVNTKAGENEKVETTPGDGQTVQVGQNISYSIFWANVENKEAEVVVVDELDSGVDFVSATDGGSYDAATHTVTWSLGRKQAGESGHVGLTVRVNSKALEPGKVENDANVKVDNKDHFTNKVENPTGGPEKTETDPGDGETVKVGQSISYSIFWANVENKEAEVVVVDELDSGVDFVSATDGGSYDAATHTVTWNLGRKQAGESGHVGLTVRVNSKALQPGKVENDANVKVDNKDHFTNKVENPTGGPEKTETDPGDGETVEVGQQITYEISWQNYKDQEAEIGIVDPLDAGVDFVSASDGGQYDAATHTVTWSLGKKPAGASGKVTLVVRVNASAETPGIVKNQATVKVDNESQLTNEVENPLGKPEIETVKKFSRNGGERTTDPMTVTVGDEITYYITVRNTGTKTAEGVTITDNVPSGLPIKSGSISDGGEYEDGVLTWYIGSLEPGESVTVHFSVTVPAVKEGSWKNIAWSDFEGNPDEPEPSNPVDIPEDPVPKTDITSDDEPNTSTRTATTVPNRPTLSSRSWESPSSKNESSSSKRDTPKTGDETDITLWLVLLAAALIVGAGVTGVRKKRKR